MSKFAVAMNETKQIGEFTEEFEGAPYYIAYKDNKMVVAEDYRVHIISDDKKVITIGKREASEQDGDFNYARGVAIQDDTIYVVDSSNDRIQLFSLTTGRFLSHFAMQGKEPFGIVIVQHKLYISCARTKEICIYSLTGTFQQSWKWSSTPCGLTYNNNLILVCESHHIEIFSAETGKLVTKFGSRGKGIGQFNCPEDIVVKDDIMYISDTGNHRIQVWKTTGEYVTCWGVRGSEDGKLCYPAGLVWKDEQLFVVDNVNQRVQVFK